jgi:hypothetical protein
LPTVLQRDLVGGVHLPHVVRLPRAGRNWVPSDGRWAPVAGTGRGTRAMQWAPRRRSPDANSPGVNRHARP